MSPLPDQSAEQLERMLHAAEDKNRSILNAMEQVLGFGDGCKRPVHQFQLVDFMRQTTDSVHALIPFDVSGIYYVDQQTSQLNLTCCMPDALQSVLENQFEVLVEKGYVAWALREMRGIRVYSPDRQHRVLLHAVATFSRIRGLFIGLMPVKAHRLPDGSLGALSLLLRNVANTLESIDYLAMFHKQNEQMQTTVEQKVGELRQLDQKRLNAQKINAIATLAGGIAHQYNNALMVLIGNLDLMKLGVATGKKFEDSYERMEAVAQKMQALTAQLLAYARGGKYRTKPVFIETIIADAYKELNKSAQALIHTGGTLPSGTYRVDVDEIQMRLALSAILKNATEALGEDGCVVVSTAKITCHDAKTENLLDLESGEYILLQIKDNGKGMDMDTVQQIFDPFFSTKLAGCGLSMAATYGIIKNHGGDILVESTLGLGTTVNVYLPVFNVF